MFLDVDPADFRDDLKTETEAIHTSYPDRYKRFFIDGTMHTTLLGDPSGIVGSDLGAVEIPPEALTRLTDLQLGGMETTPLGDTPFVDWMTAFVDGDDAWEDLTETPGPVPEWD